MRRHQKKINKSLREKIKQMRPQICKFKMQENQIQKQTVFLAKRKALLINNNTNLLKEIIGKRKEYTKIILNHHIRPSIVEEIPEEATEIITIQIKDHSEIKRIQTIHLYSNQTDSQHKIQETNNLEEIKEQNPNPGCRLVASYLSGFIKMTKTQISEIK